MPALLYDETIGAFKESAPPMIWDSGWRYDEGTDEAALLNNLMNTSKETLGKIYYIQAYYHNTSQYTESTPVSSTEMPYKVIGVNRDGTQGTVDLISIVPAMYARWYGDAYGSYIYGRYSGSSPCSWLSDTCPNGYSTNIRNCMIQMTEKWREATSATTGELQSRQTLCKLLNPVEAFGNSAATFTGGWATPVSAFANNDYGTVYPAFADSISALSSRIMYHDKAMNTPSYSSTNSFLQFWDSDNAAHIFRIELDGSCGYRFVGFRSGINPVIRLKAQN